VVSRYVKEYKRVIIGVVLGSLTLRGYNRSKLLEDRVLRRIFAPNREGVAGGRSKGLDYERHSLCPLNGCYCLFVFGATASSGPGPPHSRGF